MNECPTLVRAGLPPCSVTISGTAADVIRLWMTVAPISLLSSRAATSAVTADGEIGWPNSSTTKHRSASPSNATPRSAPSSSVFATMNSRFSGSKGLGSWFGNVPSGSK